MATTEQTQNSKDKGILKSINYKDFVAICDEYQVVEKATKELLELAKNPETKTRDKIELYKWFIEMNIGKPKQMNNISVDREGNLQNAGIFIDDKPEEDMTINIVKTILENPQEYSGNNIKTRKQGA